MSRTIITGKEIWDNMELRDEYVDTMLWSQDIFREKFYHLSYEELPDWIRDGMETRPNKTTVIKTLTVREKVWSPGDTYLVCPETQVMGGFKKGDKIRVTIENISSEESVKNAKE